MNFISNHLLVRMVYNDPNARWSAEKICLMGHPISSETQIRRYVLDFDVNDHVCLT